MDIKKEEQKKGQLISALLMSGIYKIFGKQLYELPLTILESEYNKLKGV